MAIASVLAAFAIAYGVAAALPAFLQAHRRPPRRRRPRTIEALRRMWFFSECSPHDLALIATLADQIDIPAGEAFIREGERGREFFAVIDGTVEVRKNGRKLPTKGGDELFGEIALISAAPRNATVTAVTPVRALVITEPGFSSLLRRVPHLQLKVLRTLAERGVPVWGAAFAR